MEDVQEVKQITKEEMIQAQACTRKIYRIGLVLISITIGICVFLNFKLRVSSPVVLPVCMEIRAETVDSENQTESASFYIYYVNNRGAKEKVNAVTFPEHPEWKGYGMDGIDPSATFTPFVDSSIVWSYVDRYEIHRIYVELQSIPLQETVELSQLNLHWSNGKITTEDIGEIVICHDENLSEDLDQYSSSGDSSGVTSVTCKANTDMTIQSLQSELLPEDLMDLTVTVNGEEYELQTNPQFDIPLKAGEEITLTFRENELSNRMGKPKWNQFTCMPKLVYRTSTGEDGYCRLWGINQEQYWRDQWKLYKYWKEVQN
ncbi:hypothetical protein [Anaerosporobacter faecicola]|uniref:hypothetical protein n=1 Tax=Anaerosporobacter faecicola TaxID=2718714 RepID=UPI0014399C01|nr:hypothetical protein [Anaerosporobacter faecicola]